jgi:hypothetical protein
MSTNGIWGFKIDGVRKMAYNHWDSYPTGLGIDLVEALSHSNLSALKDLARNLKVVDENSYPTEEEKHALQEFTDLNVGTGSPDDWYCVLRDTQGDLEKTLRSGYMLNGDDWGWDWSYLIDLDNEEFVVEGGDDQVLSIPLGQLSVVGKASMKALENE